MPVEQKQVVCPKCQSTDFKAAPQVQRAAELVLDGDKCPVWVDYICVNGHQFAVNIAR